jgi:hypothetical protein
MSFFSPAFLALHYRVLKWEDPAWRARSATQEALDVLRPPDERLLVGKVMSVRDAAGSFAEALSSPPSPPLGLGAQARRLIVNAIAVLGRGAWLQRQGNPSGDDDCKAAFNDLILPALLGAFPGPPHNFAVFQRAQSADEAFLLVHNAFSPPARALRHFSLSSSGTTGGVDPLGVTRVTASASATVPDGATIADYARQADPQEWAANIPEAFKATFCIPDPIVPAPVTSDPARGGVGLTPQSGSLFEEADLTWIPGAALTEFRNVLNITFVVDASTVNFGFSLFECLSTSVLGVTNQGGIDSDNGGSRIAIDASSGLATATASKNLRFSAAAPFADVLNLLTFPLLRFWLGQIVTSFSSNVGGRPR